MSAQVAAQKVREGVEDLHNSDLTTLSDYQLAKLGRWSLQLRRALEDETLRRMEAKNEHLRDTPKSVDEHAVLNALSSLAALDEDTSAMDLAHRLKCSDSTARRWVNGLVKDGLLEMTDSWVQGPIKRTAATFYSLTAEGSKRLQILETSK